MLIYRFLIVAVSVSFVVTASPRLQADTASDVRKMIEANYAKIDAAAVKNDSLTLFRFMVPGGEHIHETGKVTKFPSEADQKDMALMGITSSRPKPKISKTEIKTFLLKGL